MIEIGIEGLQTRKLASPGVRVRVRVRMRVYVCMCACVCVCMSRTRTNCGYHDFVESGDRPYCLVIFWPLRGRLSLPGKIIVGKNNTEQANIALVFMRLRLCLPFLAVCVRLCSCE